MAWIRRRRRRRRPRGLVVAVPSENPTSEPIRSFPCVFGGDARDRR